MIVILTHKYQAFRDSITQGRVIIFWKTNVKIHKYDKEDKGEKK